VSNSFTLETQLQGCMFDAGQQPADIFGEQMVVTCCSSQQNMFLFWKISGGICPVAHALVAGLVWCKV